MQDHERVRRSKAGGGPPPAGTGSAPVITCGPHGAMCTGGKCGQYEATGTGGKQTEMEAG